MQMRSHHRRWHLLGDNMYCISSKSRCTSNYRRPRNHAAHFSGWVPINAALKMTLHSKGSVKFKILVMRICVGADIQAVLRMTKNSKHKLAIVNSKLSQQSQPVFACLLHMDESQALSKSEVQTPPSNLSSRPRIVAAQNSASKLNLAAARFRGTTCTV